MPDLIPEHILEQIRQSNDVVDVIGSYFPLKRAGANFRALCPFHKEKTPSFNVNQQKQIWHCFGCGEGGDVFSFVMKYENLDFVSAVRQLAERSGIRVELESVDTHATEGGRDQKDLLLKLHEQVASFYHVNLMKEKSAAPARDYLKKRKISPETAKRWRLGYAPDSWDALVQWATARKFAPSLLESAGLALRSERGPEESRLYDRFRGRLMFPICDEQGRVVGFSGRILTEAKDQPKYVNSPETAIFHKGKILFALDKAKRVIEVEKCAIVCEGQLDTISCHEAGLANSVAPQGTALTEQHARILKRYADEVILMFDSDTAGQNAVVRGAEPLLAADLVIKVVVLPEKHDPDSFIKSFGIEKLKILVTKSPSFFVYLLDRLSMEHDLKSDRGKFQVAQQMVQALSRIPNAMLQSTYVRQTAVRLDIPESAIFQELRRIRGRQSVSQKSEERSGEISASKVGGQDRPRGLPAEEALLHLMLVDGGAIQAVSERIREEWLTGSTAAELVKRVLSLFAADRWTGPNALLNETEEELKRLVSAVLLRPALRGEVGLAVSQCLSALERRWVEARLIELRNQLQQPKLEMSELKKLQEQVLDLRRKLDHIAQLSKVKG